MGIFRKTMPFILVGTVALSAATQMSIYSKTQNVVHTVTDIDSMTFSSAADSMIVHKKNARLAYAIPSIDSVRYRTYAIHKNVKGSIFWVGEGASEDNGNITNVESAWRSHWGVDYGVEDKFDLPRDNDFIPLSSTGYKGTENPFYYALPYNDFDDNGKRRSNASKVIPWWNFQSGNTSAVKNRWISITSVNGNGKTCYAQWEDAGPYYYDDTKYVFGDGSDKPLNNTDPENLDESKLGSGLDMSPAICHYLGFTPNGDDPVVTWQFVEESEVVDGPWKKHITRTQTDW